MKKNLNISYLNGAEGLHKRGGASSEGSSGGDDSDKDFLYIVLEDPEEGVFNQVIDVLNHTIRYYSIVNLDTFEYEYTEYNSKEEFKKANIFGGNIIEEVDFNNRTAILKSMAHGEYGINSISLVSGKPNRMMNTFKRTFGKFTVFYPYRYLLKPYYYHTPKVEIAGGSETLGELNDICRIFSDEKESEVLFTIKSYG